MQNIMQLAMGMYDPTMGRQAPPQLPRELQKKLAKLKTTDIIDMQDLMVSLALSLASNLPLSLDVT